MVQILPVTGAFPINQTTYNDQYLGLLTPLYQADGSRLFASAWLDESNYDSPLYVMQIKLATFDASGARVGSEISIEAGTSGELLRFDMASIGDHPVVLIANDWLTKREAITLHFVNADGQHELGITDPSGSAANYFAITEAGTPLASDGIDSVAVTWSNHIGETWLGIYTADGAVADPVLVSTGRAGNTVNIASNDAGKIVLCDYRWIDDYNRTMNFDVFDLGPDGLTRVTSSGSIQLPEIPAQGLLYPQIKWIDDDRFLMTWQQLNATSGWDVYAQIYDANGVAQTLAPFMVNTTTINHQGSPDVLVFDDGHFLISWSDSTGSGSSGYSGVKAQLYNANGTPIGRELQLAENSNNTNTANPSLVDLGNGQFAVMRESADWTSSSSEGADLFAQVYRLADDIVIKLGDGNDRFTANASSSYMIYGFGGSDKIIGGALDDRIYGGAGNDMLYGRAGNDQLFGEAGDDRLFGESGNDLLDGGDGNDRLDGGTGHDTMIGGSGNDLYYVDELADTIIETAGNGIDSVIADTSYGLSANVENLTLIGTGNWIGNGNDLDNRIVGNAGDNQISGEDGNDRLWGNDGNDHLYGGNGNDSLYGGTGSDLMAGGAGKDVYYVDSETDSIIEEENQGYDRVISSIDHTLSANVEKLQLADSETAGRGFGNEMDNLIVGNEFENYLSGMDGNDTLKGRDGDDLILGGAGNDRLYGDNGDDILDGEGGNDRIWGGDGNDSLSGSYGVDTLYGGSGNDTLVCYDGADQASGGSGEDVFVFYGDDAGIKRVTDFEAGVDLFAYAGTTFDQLTFTVIGNNVHMSRPDSVTVIFENCAGHIFSESDFASDYWGAV